MSAEEKEKAEGFRSWWGEKAELRRFKDGSILEAVVWAENHEAPPFSTARLAIVPRCVLPVAPLSLSR